jgi:FtsH-binding integral membrane protein
MRLNNMPRKSQYKKIRKSKSPTLIEWVAFVALASMFLFGILTTETDILDKQTGGRLVVLSTATMVLAISLRGVLTGKTPNPFSVMNSASRDSRPLSFAIFLAFSILIGVILLMAALS